MFNSKKKRYSGSHNSIDASCKHYKLWRKPGKSIHILYDSAYICCPEQANSKSQTLINYLVIIKGVGMFLIEEMQNILKLDTGTV